MRAAPLGPALERARAAPLGTQHRAPFAPDDPQNVCVAGLAVTQDRPSDGDPALSDVAAWPLDGAHIPFVLEKLVKLREALRRDCDRCPQPSVFAKDAQDWREPRETR
jgi:hypothetical protein